jgi:hypothetical protein
MEILCSSKTLVSTPSTRCYNPEDWHGQLHHLMSHTQYCAWLVTALTGERYDVVLEASQAVASYWIHVKGIGPCALDETYQLAILRYIGDTRKEPGSRAPGYEGFSSVGPVTALHKLKLFSASLKSKRRFTALDYSILAIYIRPKA